MQGSQIKHFSVIVVLRSITLLLIGLAMGCTQNSKTRQLVYGQIEVDEVDVSSRVPARVARLHVKPGQRVKAGDVLVEFDADVISAKKEQALAAVSAAESRKEIAKDAVRPEEKEQIKAGVAAAAKQMELAKSSLKRAEAIFKDGAISQQNLDEIRFKAEAATEQWRGAQAKLRMAEVGARKEDQQAAQALVAQAKGAMAEAEAYAKDMLLRAPIDGEVYQILNHEGELVPAGYPVVTLIKIEEPWVSFHVPETQLVHFPMGKALTFRAPGLENVNVSTAVSFIAPMAGFANRTTTQDRGQFDLKTFELRAKLAQKIENLRPGMTVVLDLDQALP